MESSRKPVNGELNLVPFIDLLSCCISFLLITAVWTQLDRIAVRNAGSGGDVEIEGVQRPIVLVVDNDGYRVRDGDRTATIPKRAGVYDRDALRTQLGAWRGPDRSGVEVAGEDGTRYEDIVGAMDVALSVGLHDVSITAL